MNRRALLLAGGALPLLAGCRGADDGADAGAPVSETSRRGDVELLQQLVDDKARARAAYSGRHAPKGFAGVESEHLRRLQRELEARGGRRRSPSTASGADSAGRAAALDRMIDAESTSIALLVDVIPKFGDPDLRALAAQMLAVEAEQLSVLRAAAGSPPMPDAFVYGARAG